MAQRKLQLEHRRRSLIAGILMTCSLSLLGLLQGCAHANDSIGLTLLFTNKGPHSLGVARFDPDGQRGPVPGALGVGGSAQMTFMAGDSKRGVPKFVEVGWSIETPDIKAMRKIRDERYQLYSNAWIEETKRINAATPDQIRRIDLAPILTPELLAQVRSSSASRLKLTVVFKGEDVDVIAEPEVMSPKKYSSSDTSPEAMAWGREQSAMGQEVARKAFYVKGHYLGRATGALAGRLIFGVTNDGRMNAVLRADNGQTFVLSGAFEIQSLTPVRVLQLQGTDTQGHTIAITGEFDLKAKRIQGTWQLSLPTPLSGALEARW